MLAALGVYMDRLKIWSVASYAWTEIGLDDDEYPKHAEAIQEDFADWKTVNAIFTKDVCGSFAVDTFLIFPCMLWMIMPDWGYEEEYLKSRMDKWYSKPYWFHFLNPARLLGFPLALVFSMGVRRKLKRAYVDFKQNT